MTHTRLCIISVDDLLQSLPTVTTDAMGKFKRGRKKPLTHTEPLHRTDHVATQSTISTYHTLLKRKAVLQRRLEQDPEHVQSREELSQIEEQLLKQGGLQAYQAASVLGQSTERGGDSAKVLIGWLLPRRENFVRTSEKNKLR